MESRVVPTLAVAAALAVLVVPVAAAAPICDPPRELRGALADLDAGRDLSLPAAQGRARTLAQLAALRQRHPEAGELWRRTIELEKEASADRKRVIDRYKPRAAQQKDAEAHYRYGRALLGHDTRAALVAFERTLDLAPGHPDALAALVDIHRSRGFTDQKKATQRLDQLAESCPGSARVLRYRGKDQRTTLAALLRAEAEGPLPGDPAALTALWDLEFKLRPPTEHAALRVQIAATTARIREGVPLGQHPGYLAALKRGYHLTSDAAGKTWLEAEVVRLLPHGREAMTLETGRWDKAHPAPSRESSPEGQAHQRALVAATAGWVTRWPADPWLWHRHLGALRNLDKPEGGAVARAVRLALAAQTRHQLGDQLTVPLAVARVQLKHRVGLAEAVRRLERAPADWKAAQERTRSDLNGAPDPKRAASAERDVEWQTWPVLAEIHARAGQAARAQAVLARMDGAITAQKAAGQGQGQGKDKSPPDVSGRLFTRHRAAGAVAEAQGRKREAVLAYRDALAAQWSSGLRDKARTLWTESGGDEAGWKTLAIAEPAKGQGKDDKAPEERWEKTTRGLPKLVLSDLAGKTWTSRDLAGKTLFVNMWATWCGPCKAELPQVKKLHERLAGRTDVLLVSLNVDDSVGDVEPFVKEQEIGYPVLLANDYVVSMLNGFSIPRNWLVNPVGVMMRQQIGYDPAEADRWVDDALAQIDAVSR